jgi:hypothetical protein
MRASAVLLAILVLVSATVIPALGDAPRPSPYLGQLAAAAQALAQPIAGQGTGSPAPHSPTAPTKGMRKEQVRVLWGEPAEVRRIRTCFGTKEEWVYRGDPARYGGQERTLLFDEGEILEELK